MQRAEPGGDRRPITDAAPLPDGFSSTGLTIIPMSLDFGSVVSGTTMTMQVANGAPDPIAITAIAIAIAITAIDTGGDSVTARLRC